MRLTLLQLIRHSAAAPDDGSDADLLRRFADHRDEAAFAALVDRHGAMVWAVCRHAVPNRADAEDVFQATFFALSRGARAVRRPERLGAWLHGAAVRIAGAAKRAHARRVRRERAAARPEADHSVPAAAWDELHAAAHAEVAGLPPALRAAFVLCDLEGLEAATAAARLGVKVNTLSGQLARARRLLLDRLTKRGVGPAAVALGPAVAAPPLAARQAAATVGGPASATITTLAKEATAMSLPKFTFLAVGLAVVVGSGVLPTADGQTRIVAETGEKVSMPAFAAKEVTLGGWGTVTDPDNDCTFTVSKDRLSIGLPGTDHALGFERGQMNAPRVLQDVAGDFIAQVKVSGEYPAGAKTRVSDRRPFHGAGLLLWVDAKNYIRLERAALVNDDKKHMSYASFEQRAGGEFVRRGTAQEVPLTGQATYLRLERRGAKVYGAASADGAKWTSFEPLPVALPKLVRVGVAAGHNTSAAFTPAFDEFKLFTEKAAK